MGVNALKQNLGSSREEAQKYLDEYFNKFSGLAKYLENTKTEAEAKKLIAELDKAVGLEGSILVYFAPFEKGVLQEMADTFPAYRERIESIVERILDLNTPFSNFICYHPDQMGSASLKQVLPALTGLGYGGLEIAEGQAAGPKFMESVSGGITPEEKKIMQDIIDSLHLQFIEVIDQGRKELTLAEIKPLADGRIYTAKQALDYKLIDAIGYLDDAISLAKAQAGIEEARIVTYHRPMAYKNNIYSQASINLINFGDHGILENLPVSFMFLWNP